MTRNTWRNIFVGIIFLALLNYLPSIQLIAQNHNNYEVITVENIDNLVEIQSWSIIDTDSSFISASFSPDASELAIELNNGQLEFLSTETFETLRVVNVETETDRINYSLDGHQVVLSDFFGGQYTLIDIETQQILASNTEMYNEDMFSPIPDISKYIRWDFFDEGISLYDMISDEEMFTVEDAGFWNVNHDGTLLLTRNDELIVTIWDIETGESIFEILPPEGDIPNDNLYGAGFTPDGLVWTNYPQPSETDERVTWYSPIQFWDISSGEMVFELEGDEYYSSVIFDMSNSYALTSGIHIQSYSNQCWGWDLKSGERFSCPAAGNMSLTLSPNDDILAVNSGTDFNVYLHEFGNPIRRVSVLETNPTWYVEFSSDGKFLLTIDTSIHLWAIPSE